MFLFSRSFIHHFLIILHTVKATLEGPTPAHRRSGFMQLDKSLMCSKVMKKFQWKTQAYNNNNAHLHVGNVNVEGQKKRNKLLSHVVTRGVKLRSFSWKSCVCVCLLAPWRPLLITNYFEAQTGAPTSQKSWQSAVGAKTWANGGRA